MPLFRVSKKLSRSASAIFLICALTVAPAVQAQTRPLDRPSAGYETQSAGSLRPLSTLRGDRSRQRPGSGTGNRALVHQRGIGNSAAIHQSGDGNLVIVRQIGTGHSLDVSQINGGNTALVIQIGTGTHVDVNQTGGQTGRYIVSGN